MKRNESSVDVIRQSSELIQESRRLKQRAREALDRSAAIIDRSRELLARRSVNGSPTLPTVQKPLTVTDNSRKNQDGEGNVSAASYEEATLERVEGRDFVNETVCLDGRHFADCTLKNCVLEYNGSHLMLESTTFTGCRFRFGREAAMTVAMLECFGLFGGQHADSVLPPLAALPGSSRVN